MIIARPGRFITRASIASSENLEFDENGTIRIKDILGMQWNEAHQQIGGETGSVTVVDYSGQGVLLCINASFGAYATGCYIEVYIDGSLWKKYECGSTPRPVWVDDSADHNSGYLVLVPFKRFNSNLKVVLYNADSAHESDCKVIYLTPIG